MKKFGLLFVLLLAACNASVITPATIYKVRVGYDAAVLAPAARYRVHCDSAPTVNCKAVVRKLQTADQAANIVISTAVGYVRSNPKGPQTSAYINAAIAAVTAATNIALTYGVK